MHNPQLKKTGKSIENATERAFREAGVGSVLVAVSGGADSVALLRLCCRLAPRLGLRVEAANCNFHLRGEESDRDSAFTARLCERLGVRLHSLDYDVEAHIATHPGESTEMACRELRYADFFRILTERGLDRVAVAHNSDDDVETMLLNLLRGSGVRGLKGMEADNGRVFRPLLGATRKEIEEYLAVIGQDFITDSSNLTSDYRRNFLRHDVIPLLESRWPGARKSLLKTLSIVKEESGIVEAHHRSRLEALCPDASTLFVYSDGVTAGTITRFLEPFGGNATMAEEIMECRGRDYGERSWRLSGRYTAHLERDRLIISDDEEEATDPFLTWEKLELNCEAMDGIKRNRNHRIIYLPDDGAAYELRRPQTGDRMAPLGMKGTRLVSDIISDARLDRKDKEAVRVLARKTDGEIIWVTGLKRSRHDLIAHGMGHAYKATLNTQPLTLNPY